MARSYYFIKKGDFSIYFTKQIFHPDAIIIDIEDADYLFSNFNKYYDIFDELKKQNKEIYLKLDTKDLKKTYLALNKTKGEYLTGWLIPNTTLIILNKLVLKVREYEQNQKMNFGTLNFIATIDSPEAVINYRKIASYERVKALVIDEKNYSNYLGLEYHQDNNFLRNQVHLLSALSKKQLIDGVFEDENLIDDLIKGKRIGATSKATTNINQVETINDFYTPKREEIEYAKLIVNSYLNAPKKLRKKIIIDGKPLSQYKIIRSQELLLRARSLGLEEEKVDLKLIVKDEKIKDASKAIHPKKFYTIGEEIANSITHGVGILFSLMYFILLLLKGIKNNNNLEIFAYSVYSLSAFILYLSSTLYHGLGLGSRAKKLFQKFDHMTIYLLIAGTYTPFTLIALERPLGIFLCIFLWIGAFTGFFLNLFWFGKMKSLHMVLYVALGWVAIFYIKTITLSIGTMGTLLLISGGVAYTLGIIFYGLKLFKFTHMVWHIFTIIGTLLHFFTILLYL